MGIKIKTAVLGLVVLLPLVASAEVARPKTGVIKDLRQDLKENRMQVATTTQERMEKRDERRETLLRIAGIKLQNMIDRFEATMSRLNGITNKVISRIEKVRTNGGNTANAEKYVADAQKHFADARIALTKLETATSTAKELLASSDVSTSTVIKTGLKKIKDIALTVESEIKEGHKSLNNALKELRGMSSAHATTTSNSN